MNRIRIPQVFMERLCKSNKSHEVYTTAGGNILHAWRVEWSPGKFCWDFSYEDD